MTNSQVLDKHILPACNEGNGYVFRDGQRKGRWCVYFINKSNGNRHRIVLKGADGRYPNPTLDGLEDAKRLGTKTYFDLKNKIDRGEKIKSLRIRDMVDMFLKEERKRISDVPHAGITQQRWYLLTRETNHYLAFVKDKLWGLGKSDLCEIHKMNINHLDGYFTYRRKTTNDTDKRGRPLPRKQTVKSEVSTIHRMYETIGVKKRYINRNSLPIKPTQQLRVTTKETQDIRRSMFEVNEYLDILKNSTWYIKGLSKFDRNGKLWGDENGEPIRKSVIFGKGDSPRAKHQIVHREMVYLAMRITMETGIRIGTLQKLRWSNIKEIPKRANRDPEVYKEIRVLSEQGKTARYYEIPAPITGFINRLKKISNYTKSEDYIFANQKDGSKWSERIWHEGLVDMCMEANLADRNKDAVNKVMIVKSGKDISWYSFRHSFISWRLNSGHPIQEIAAHCDTSIEYIQKHYYHPDLMSSKMIDNLELGRYTETFGKGEPAKIEVFETDTGRRVQFNEGSLFAEGNRDLSVAFTEEEMKEFPFTEDELNAKYPDRKKKKMKED